MTGVEKYFSDALSDKTLSDNQDWVIRLGFLIHDAARLRRIAIDETFKPLEITRSQAWLLAYVSRKDGQTQSELAAQMSLGKVGIVGLIDRLEKSEMIERRIEGDRRAKRIYITDKGRKVVRSMRQLTMEANKDILAGLDIKQIKQTVITLDKIKSNIEQMTS